MQQKNEKIKQSKEIKDNWDGKLQELGSTFALLKQLDF